MVGDRLRLESHGAGGGSDGGAEEAGDARGDLWHDDGPGGGDEGGGRGGGGGGGCPRVGGGQTGPPLDVVVGPLTARDQAVVAVPYLGLVMAELSTAQEFPRK